MMMTQMMIGDDRRAIRRAIKDDEATKGPGARGGPGRAGCNEGDGRWRAGGTMVRRWVCGRADDDRCGRARLMGGGWAVPDPDPDPDPGAGML